MQLFDQIQDCIQYIHKHIQFEPTVGMVLGTGLSGLADEIEVVHRFEYSELPHFPVSTVESHKGQLIFGHLEGRAVVAMAGRFHYYEGYTMQQVTFPIRILKYLGIQQLILSNASGGLQTHIEAGDLVFIRDHINLHAGHSLRGENDERIGPRFPDMMYAYDPKWLAHATQIAKENNIRAHQGVYAGLQGPSLETPAEYRYLHIIGGDVVGMSTVPEVIVARHMDLPVFVLSVVSNKCFPIEDLTPTTIEEVLEVVEQASPKAALIVKEIVRLM
ncbi:MAG: purine-nucleoside phosphorylase [Bacteroidota bacterium]